MNLESAYFCGDNIVSNAELITSQKDPIVREALQKKAEIFQAETRSVPFQFSKVRDNRFVFAILLRSLREFVRRLSLSTKAIRFSAQKS